MPIKQTINKGQVPIKIYTDEVEGSAMQQLINMAQLPILHGHIAVMPDVHTGIGATVGSVIPTRGAIIPAAIGVDIGCGMNAVRLSLTAEQLPDNLRTVRSGIEAAVPVGFAEHKDNAAQASTLRALDKGLDQLIGKHPGIQKMMKNLPRTWARQLGTLGGGNHFIELCLDEDQNVWVMLHSGSRGIGNVIGRYFIALARKDMERHLQQLPDRDLAYFEEGAEHFDDYVEAVHWAQDYALTNRREMMHLILDVLKQRLPGFEITKEAINCHHNYVAIEEHYGAQVYVTRKGAIRAGEGELGIIPGSMGAKSFIVRGKGNAESFCSCSHGAGRRMSRSKAKRQFNLEDMERQTHGVECRKDESVIDEIPGAYKDIDEV
ncbi:MAG: RtcB family protein, partial [Gammaproteobacteria bacterium]|nr:RtcB family protein [Gammaproteobacteria bacterium]